MDTLLSFVCLHEFHAKHVKVIWMQTSVEITSSTDDKQAQDFMINTHNGARIHDELSLAHIKGYDFTTSSTCSKKTTTTYVTKLVSDEKNSFVNNIRNITDIIAYTGQYQEEVTMKLMIIRMF